MQSITVRNEKHETNNTRSLQVCVDPARNTWFLFFTRLRSVYCTHLLARGCPLDLDMGYRTSTPSISDLLTNQPTPMCFFFLLYISVCFPMCFSHHANSPSWGIPVCRDEVYRESVYIEGNVLQSSVQRHDLGKVLQYDLIHRWWVVYDVSSVERTQWPAYLPRLYQVYR